MSSEENLLPLNEDDAEKIKGMIRTLVRFRRREAANNKDVYYITGCIDSLRDLHEIKGWGEVN